MPRKSKHPLSKLRQRARFTQRQLSELLEVDRATLQAWEQRNSIPEQYQRAYCKATGATIWELIEIDAVKSINPETMKAWLKEQHPEIVVQ
jgi:transcriptional regulator with XRE-family HTH domain